MYTDTGNTITNRLIQLLSINLEIIGGNAYILFQGTPPPVRSSSSSSTTESAPISSSSSIRSEIEMKGIEEIEKEAKERKEGEAKKEQMAAEK